MYKDIPIIVAGGGPSLAKIDYNRIPQDVKIFRVNSFYFEDIYYLGKNVDFYMATSGWFDSMYFTLLNLIKRKEYNFDKMYTYEVGEILDNDMETFIEDYPFMINALPLLKQNKLFYANMFLYTKYYHKKFYNSGIISLFLAYELGFRKFYITGYDFYNSEDYPWDSSAKTEMLKGRFSARSFFSSDNYLKKSQNYSPFTAHPLEMQIEALELLKTMPDIELYSISSNSTINKYIPLAPVLDKPNMLKEDKSEDSIKDWLPLPENFIRKNPIKDFLDYQRVRLLACLVPGKKGQHYKYKKRQLEKFS